MNSYERTSFFGRQPFFRPGSPPPENLLQSEQVEIEHRSFKFMLKENQRGRFLHVTEKAADSFHGLIVPAPGLEEFANRLTAIANANTALPAPAERTLPDTSAPEAGQCLFQAKPLDVERKIFTLELREALGGRFLQISEISGGHNNDLIVPIAGLEIFQRLIQAVARAALELPPFNPLLPPPSRKTGQEHIFKTVMVPVERKTFMLVLKENPRGRYLRLTERAGGRFSCLIVAAAGFAEFKERLAGMVKAAGESSPTLSPVRQLGGPFIEELLKADQMEINGKFFRFLLRENVAGRFLRLIEESATHLPQNLIIPASGLEEFQKQVDDLIRISDEHPTSFFVDGKPIETV